MLGVAPGGASAAASATVLLFLHTLGFVLVALGVAVAVLLVAWRRTGIAWLGWAAVAAIAIGEGANAWAIHQAGSMLFIGPLVAVALVVVGVAVGERARCVH
jgi:uncharacterized membrane protein